MLLFLVDLINIEKFRISFCFFYSFSFILRSRATSVWYQSHQRVILATLRVICFRLIMVENNWLLYDGGMYLSCNFAFITAHWVIGGSPRRSMSCNTFCQYILAELVNFILANRTRSLSIISYQSKYSSIATNQSEKTLGSILPSNSGALT